nr:unnamed protein product [Callosobruchus analis]
MHPKKLLTFFVCSCCISVILVVFGILLICFTHIIYEAILKGNLVLQPGSSAFQVWRNGSEDFDGEFNMDTGISGGQIGQLKRWKFQDHTPYYPEKCGRFDGASAGDFFPGNLKKDSIIKMFSSDLCRFVELEFAEEVMIHGITGYKFIAGERFLDNGTKIPENKCFCDGDCMPSGALNVSNCRHGSPAFVTLPSFYSADPYYTRHIEGVIPVKERDEFYMIFEPKTGIPLEVAARLQLNLRIQPIPGVTLYRSLPTVFFPALYFEQFVSLPEDMTMSIKLLVHFEIICLAVGIFCISAGLLAQFCLCYKACNTRIIQRNGSKRRNSREDTNIKEQVPLKQCG